jgi:hypothetical protein
MGSYGGGQVSPSLDISTAWRDNVFKARVEIYCSPIGGICLLPKGMPRESLGCSSPVNKTAPSAFDPYHRWLGIPPSEQPPHHYRLLGIGLFEEDPEVIQSASDRQMAHVRTFQTGRYVADSQRLLNELSAAKICLLNDVKRQEYENRLRRRLENKGELQPVSRKIAGRASHTLAQPFTQPTPEQGAKQIPYLGRGVAIEAPAYIDKQPLPQAITAPQVPAAPPVVTDRTGETNSPEMAVLAAAIRPAPAYARPIGVARRKSSSAALAIFLGVVALAMLAALVFLLLN